MKFDLIVGNPPYYRSLHLKILEYLLPFGKEIVWISPVRWLQDPLAKYKKNSDLLKYRDTILTRTKGIEVVSATDAISMFDSARFTMNLAIYHLTESNKDTFDISSVYNNEWIIDHVVDRVVNGEIDSIADHYLDKDALDMSIPFMRFSDIHGHDQDDWYILLSPDHKLAFDKNAKAVGGLNFNTQEEAENFFNYMQTDFIKFLGLTIKLDLHVPLSFIPYMNDYNRPWTDEDLYKLFDITEEEQKIIRDAVKSTEKKRAKEISK